MAELVRLNYLIGFPDSRANATDWIFECNARDWRVQQERHKGKRISLLGLLFLEPAGSADRQMGAWRMGNHQIPSTIESVFHIALIVMAVILGRPVTVPLVMLVFAVLILALAVVLAAIVRLILRDGLRFYPGTRTA